MSAEMALTVCEDPPGTEWVYYGQGPAQAGFQEVYRAQRRLHRDACGKTERNRKECSVRLSRKECKQAADARRQTGQGCQKESREHMVFHEASEVMQYAARDDWKSILRWCFA